MLLTPVLMHSISSQSPNLNGISNTSDLSIVGLQKLIHVNRFAVCRKLMEKREFFLCQTFKKVVVISFRNVFHSQFIHYFS